MPPKRTNMNAAEMERLIAERVAEAIAADRPIRNNGDSGAGGSGGTGTGASETVVRPCTYKDFISCKPPNFTGTEGAVGLLRWIEKLESVFGICNCAEDSKVKFATCTLSDDALTWWNSYAQSVGVDVAFQLPWEELKQRMKNEYCPGYELDKLDEEFWKLKVVGYDIASYTSRFHQLANLCPHMVTPESKRIDRYIKGLPDSVQGNVTASKPADIESTITMAHTLIAQKVRSGIAPGGNTANKNQNQNQNNKRKRNDGSSTQATEPAKVYAVGTENKKEYKGKLPFCNKCSRHHNGQCGVQCENCKRFGHATKDCRAKNPVNQQTPANNQAANNPSNQKNPKACFECGGIGHFKNQCGNLRNRNNNNANNNNVNNANANNKNNST